MPTLHNRQRIGRPRPHGLTWADIEALHQPQRARRSPVAFALAGAFFSGAAVGMVCAILVVVLT